MQPARFAAAALRGEAKHRLPRSPVPEPVVTRTAFQGCTSSTEPHLIGYACMCCTTLIRPIQARPQSAPHTAN